MSKVFVSEAPIGCQEINTQIRKLSSADDISTHFWSMRSTWNPTDRPKWGSMSPGNPGNYNQWPACSPDAWKLQAQLWAPNPTHTEWLHWSFFCFPPLCPPPSIGKQPSSLSTGKTNRDQFTEDQFTGLLGWWSRPLGKDLPSPKSGTPLCQLLLYLLWREAWPLLGSAHIRKCPYLMYTFLWCNTI